MSWMLSGSCLANEGMELNAEHLEEGIEAIRVQEEGETSQARKKTSAVESISARLGVDGRGDLSEKSGMV